MKKVHLIISGEVQEVLYRSNSVEKAQILGLKGWVKNTSGGKVEIIAEGEKENLEKFIEWCRKGPSFAKVSGVKIDWEESTGEFSSFEVKT